MGKIGQAQGSLNVQESFFFFFSILQFFLNLDYNESLYYCNCCMFEENFIFAKILVPEISPKMLLANQIARFLNQSQDSKIGCISQRKIFLIFGTMVNNSNIEKPTEPFFQENSFLPKFGQKGPRMAPKQFFVNFLKNFIMLVFLGNNIEKMKTNIVIDISPTYLAKFQVSSYGPKCCQPIKLQDSLKCNTIRKK